MRIALLVALLCGVACAGPVVDTLSTVSETAIWRSAVISRARDARVTVGGTTVYVATDGGSLMRYEARRALYVDEGGDSYWTALDQREAIAVQPVATGEAATANRTITWASNSSRYECDVSMQRVSRGFSLRQSITLLPSDGDDRVSGMLLVLSAANPTFTTVSVDGEDRAALLTGNATMLLLPSTVEGVSGSAMLASKSITATAEEAAPTTPGVSIVSPVDLPDHDEAADGSSSDENNDSDPDGSPSEAVQDSEGSESGAGDEPPGNDQDDASSGDSGSGESESESGSSGDDSEDNGAPLNNGRGGRRRRRLGDFDRVDDDDGVLTGDSVHILTIRFTRTLQLPVTLSLEAVFNLLPEERQYWEEEGGSRTGRDGDDSATPTGDDDDADSAASESEEEQGSTSSEASNSTSVPLVATDLAAGHSSRASPAALLACAAMLLSLLLMA